MNLNKVLHYLNTTYPYTGGITYTQAVEQLTEAISSSSISAVTKAIRESGERCPKIVLTVDDNKYSFKACVKEVWLNFDRCFVSKRGYLDDFNGFCRTGEAYEGAMCLENADMPIYYGHSLFHWIQYGHICDECGIVYIKDDSTYEGLCHTCSQAYKVLPYNTQADQVLGIEETKDTLFGIELEYENITAYDVAKCLKGHAISKSDVSIHSGVEIVTRPACLATHKERLQPFYDAVKVAAKSNTGMHVHVDRSKLTTYQMGFMMEFLNKEELIPHITTIAGRNYSENSYCKTSKSVKMTWGNKFDEGSYKLHKQATQRYSSFNTAKDKTVEIRIFSSPESYEEVCAKLDFVAALVKYSSPYSVSVKRLSDKFIWENFTGFIAANKKDYPHFYNYFLKEAK